MKYSVEKMAKEYLCQFENSNFDIDRPYLPEFNFDAYNDNEYLNAIKDINNAYDKVDDLKTSIKFLTQDSFEDDN